MDGTTPGPDAAPSPTLLFRTVTVVNARGLHARAAAKFVTLAERYGASVEVLRDGQSVSARSIMGLMMLGAGQGSQLELAGGRLGREGGARRAGRLGRGRVP